MLCLFTMFYFVWIMDTSVSVSEVNRCLVVCRCQQLGCLCSTLCSSSCCCLCWIVSFIRCWTGVVSAHHCVSAWSLAWWSQCLQCLKLAVLRECDWTSTGTMEQITRTGRW